MRDARDAFSKVPYATQGFFKNYQTFSQYITLDFSRKSGTNINFFEEKNIRPGPHGSPGRISLPLPLTLQQFQCLEAFRADIFVFEDRDVLGDVAENAAGFVLFENNRRAFHIDFQCVPLSDIQRAAHFDGQYDPAQLVHFSHDPGRFHDKTPFSIGLPLILFG